MIDSLDIQINDFEHIYGWWEWLELLHVMKIWFLDEVIGLNDDSQSDLLQDSTGERSRILAIMRKNGLELREDGSGWVSIQGDENETKRIDLPEDDEPIGKTSAVFCLIVALGLLLAASQAESLGCLLYTSPSPRD